MQEAVYGNKHLRPARSHVRVAVFEPLRETSHQPDANAAARPEPALLRAERSGLIDALFFAATVAEFYFLTEYLKTEAYRPPVWLVFPALITWGLLMAGALAPLMRRPTPKPGELPRGSGPVLAVWATLFIAWVAILFNTSDEALWGFWHLCHVNNDEYAVLAALLPVPLAPCWRRWVRRFKLRALKRRRAAGNRRPIRVPHWPALAVLGALLYAYLLRDHAIWSDGWGILGFTRNYGRLGPEGFREPLFNLFFREASRPLMAMGLHAGQAVGLFNTIGTIPVFVMFHLQMRHWNYTSRQLAAGWLLIASTLGITQMALGHIELYPLLIAGMVGTIYAGLGAMEGRWSPAWPSIIFAIVLAGHLSAIFILPALLAMLWLRAVPEGRLLGPVDRPVLAQGCLHLLGWGLLIHGPLWLGLMVGLERPTPLGIVAAVGGSLNTGSENLTFIGSDAPTLVAQIRQILGAENLFKVFQALFYLAGGTLLACIAALFARAFGWRPAQQAGRPDPRTAAALWVAFGGYFFYTLTWHADWLWMEDWDLFSGIAPLALYLALRMLMPARGVTRVPFHLLAPAAVFALALSVSQHEYNHTRATFLNRSNKVDANRVYGAQIQKLQLTHVYPRFTGFEYVDGKVVAIPPLPPAGARK